MELPSLSVIFDMPEACSCVSTRPWREQSERVQNGTLPGFGDSIENVVYCLKGEHLREILKICSNWLGKRMDRMKREGNEQKNAGGKVGLLYVQ